MTEARSEAISSVSKQTKQRTKMDKPPIGCHLIIYGQRANDDFEGVLKEVGEAGYDGVETRNLSQDTNPDYVTGILDSCGLK